MRIQGANRPGTVAAGGGARRAEGAASTFSLAGGEQPASSATSSAPIAIAGLDALIALQSIDADAPRKKRKALRRGHDLLDRLDEIKAGLLCGTLSGEAIGQIVTLIDGIEPSGDERLDELLADIALRAEVELAKLGRYRS